MKQHQYVESPAVFARGVAALDDDAKNFSESTARLYCDLGLLDFIKLPNGMRLLRPDQHGKARQLYRERLARRGHPRAEAAAS